MMDGENEIEAQVSSAAPSRTDVLEIRGQRVILDHRVAAAFGIVTKQLNQAYTRNRERFTDRDAFELTDDEQKALRSQIVTSKPKRGGRRYNHIVFTRRGIVVLATILRSQRARDAANQIIDLFVEVYDQVNAGRQLVTIANPDQYRIAGASEEEQKQLRDLRKTIIDGLLDLSRSLMRSDAADAVRDAARELPGGLFQNIGERLREKGLQNEKLIAEAQLAYAQVTQVLAQSRKTHSEADSVDLANLQKKLEIMKGSLDLLRQLEPTVVVAAFHALDRTPDYPQQIDSRRPAPNLPAPEDVKGKK